MADRHKHPPLYFRPASEDDRAWLAEYAKASGKKPNRILAEALASLRASLSGDERAAVQRHAEHDAGLVCRPAGNGLCIPLETTETTEEQTGEHR